MACKYTYKGITYNSKEEFISQVVNSQILGKADVILPIGTSGSGKSTFIKSLPQENLVVIEPDAMRVEFTGDINDKSKDKEIYTEATKRAVTAIKQGKQVVFDTTNLIKDKRLPFIEAIKKIIPTANIQYKLMELNPELAKQRIKAQIARGENRANVPDSTIDRHAESYKQMLEDIKSEPITPFVDKTDSKTRRILEVQSDLFQKGRGKKELTGQDVPADEFSGMLMSAPEGIDIEPEFKRINESKTGNQFLQLLNKDSNWVTFFIKSIIQDSAKKGYEKVLFPSGNTASKVEGHTTLEEFKKQKEDRIKELEDKLKTLDSLKPNNDNSPIDFKLGNSNEKLYYSKIGFNEAIKKYKEPFLNEIFQLKQELERLETEGFGALKPIYNFYENTVTNILNKTYGKENVKVITDEYGNTWNEIDIVPEREQQSILLQTAEMPSSKAAEETVAVMKQAAEQMGIDIQDLLDYAKANPSVDVKNVNGLADLIKGVVAIAQGKEDVAIVEEIVHVATAILEQTNPKLITELISKISRFKIYNKTFEAYKNKYVTPEGKPDIRKIKKEAVDKLIAEVIINQSEGSTEFPELMEETNRNIVQQWWENILDAIRGLYKKTNIDIFREASEQVLNSQGTTKDINSNQIYLQKEVKKEIANEIAEEFKPKEKANERKFNRPTNLPESFRMVFGEANPGGFIPLEYVLSNGRGNKFSQTSGLEQSGLSYYSGTFGHTFEGLLSLKKGEKESDLGAQKRYANLRVIESLSRNNILLGLSRKLGIQEIRIIDDPRKAPLFAHKGQLYINENEWLKNLKEKYSDSVNLDDYVDVAVFEELIHITATALSNKEVLEKEIKNLNNTDKLVIDKFYTDDYNLSNSVLDDYNRVHELIRMKVQKDLIGKSTEDIANNDMVNSLVNKIWDFLLSLFKNKLVLSNRIAEDVKDFIKNDKSLTNTFNDKEILGLPKITNPLINKLYNKYIDIDSRMELIPEITDSTGKVSKRHYTFDGKPANLTVTEKVKGGKKPMKERTAIQKIDDETKRQWGDEGHKFIDNYITNNLIDKDGYKKEFTSTPVSTKLSKTLQKQLANFAKELINSYPEGSRFLTERKVINTKEKGMLASTVDFKAFYPITKKDGTQDIKIDTLDWKFTSIDKTREEDVPWFKVKDWVPQMGEYTKIDKEYGARPDQIGKARMIPFIINYDSVIKDDKKSGLIPATLEVGKLDSLTETNLYLLPVPGAAESTGNSEVDALVHSLKAHWEKMYKFNKNEDKFEKDIRLNELSKAIRNLQVKLNFAPLVNVADTFFKNARKTVDEFELLDLSTINEKELQKKIHELIEYKNSSEKFASMDETFLSLYPRETLSKENKETLLKLEHNSKVAERMQEKILELYKIFTINLAVKQGIVTESNKETILNPEIAVSGMSKTWEEASKLSPKLIKLVANLNINAGSLVQMEYVKQMKTFGELLIPLEKEAQSLGKRAFDMIAKMTDTGLDLIKKLDKEFIEEIKEAKNTRNRKFFISNIDVVEYNKLSKELIIKNTEVINNTKYSQDEVENGAIKEYKISTLQSNLNINRSDFNGYYDYDFNQLFWKTLKEENHYSSEYKQLLKSKNAHNVWKLLSKYNEKADELGYFEKKDSSFFPLIEATILEKMGAASNPLNEIQDIFKGLYSTKINEEQALSKIDPETGQPVRTIPRYFTKTDKEVKQLSTDLNKVVALWIKALLDYEKASSLDDTFEVLLAVEKTKGSLMLNERNEVMFDSNDVPLVNKDESKNYEIMKVIADDARYNLGQDLGSIGNIGITMLSGKIGKSEEGKAKAAVNIKKTLHNLDTYTRSIAVGLKPLITIANWFGNQMQMYINAGGLYKAGEFEKNNAKVSVNNLSLIEKALLELFVPLNDDVTSEERRKISKKIGIGASLSTWSYSDVMMITNSFPEKKLQLANALSMIENSMIKNGRIVNIRQFLAKEDLVKYKMSQEERKELEKTFEERVKALKQTSSLLLTAKIENDEVIIPGVSIEEQAKFRTTIVEFGRKLNGQMNTDNKAGYRRDAIFSSFMMFKTWMPKLLGERITGIDKNAQLEQWEYGRIRVLVKTWQQLGTRNIFKIKEIISGSEEGLQILNEMLENKRQDYFKKTGQILEITDEEFYDLIRRELTNEMKELQVLLLMMAMFLSAKAAVPPDDADGLTKNKYKLFAKTINKISDEITFYYSPLSFEGMTKGSVLPSLNLLTKAERVIIQVGKEFGPDSEKAHGMKAVFSVIPGLSQGQTEILPYVAPEYAKEIGIKVVIQPTR